MFDFEKYNFVTPIMKPEVMDRAELLDRVMNNYRRFSMNKSFFQHPWGKDSFRRKYLMGCLKSFLKSGFERTYHDPGRVGYRGPKSKKKVDFKFADTRVHARPNPAAIAAADEGWVTMHGPKIEMRRKKGEEITAPARIGPNAITQVAAVLPAWLGSATARAVFEHAGLLHHWNQPPPSMMGEGEVRQLHLALYAAPGATQAAEVAAAADCRTADYLLAHRIPPPAQHVLEAPPPGLAARALLAAVTRHAWTFAGSARFQSGARLVGWHVRVGADASTQAWMTLQQNPLLHLAGGPSAGCALSAAVFERLFRVLVHARSRGR